MDKPASRDTRAADQIIAAARRAQDERAQSYRGQALKLFPWICGRCQREFNARNLHELTVHHKNHNHDDNPPDGSNWELLCLYCHDNEHARQLVADATVTLPGRPTAAVGTHKPFADLQGLLKPKPES